MTRRDDRGKGCPESAFSRAPIFAEDGGTYLDGKEVAMLPNVSDSRMPMRRGGLVRVWLVVVAACGVVGLATFLGMGPKSGAAPAPVFRSAKATPEEIDRLHNELGNANEQQRMRAYHRLLQIGPPSLLITDPSQEGTPTARSIFRDPRTASSDPNKLRLFFRLVEQIQKRHGPQSIREGGLAFTPFGGRVWKIPPPGGKTKVEIGIKIKNEGKKAIRFCLLGISSPLMLTENAEKVQPSAWGKILYERDYLTPLLQPGDTYSAKFVGAELRSSIDGKEIHLVGRIFKTYCDFGRMGLKKGRYYISYTCGSVRYGGLLGPPPPKDESTIWSGEVDTLFIPVDIQ